MSKFATNTSCQSTILSMLSQSAKAGTWEMDTGLMEVPIQEQAGYIVTITTERCGTRFQAVLRGTRKAVAFRILATNRLTSKGMLPRLSCSGLALASRTMDWFLSVQTNFMPRGPGLH